MKRSKIIPFIFFTLAVTACTTPNYGSLEESDYYKVFGRTAIKHPTQSGQVSFAIEQAKNSTINIIIQGPFAQGRADIEIADNETTITIDEQTFKDRGPDQLFYNLTGIEWPVSGTQNWIKGKPYHPDTHITYDKDGKIERFNEDGWNISYQEWTTKSGLELPLKMTITRGNDIRLRFLIDNWIIR